MPRQIMAWGWLAALRRSEEPREPESFALPLKPAARSALPKLPSEGVSPSSLLGLPSFQLLHPHGGDGLQGVRGGQGTGLSNISSTKKLPAVEGRALKNEKSHLKHKYNPTS